MMGNEKKIKPFMSIRATARATGISEFRLRAMLRENTLPGFYSGTKYNVDVETLVKKLRERSNVDGT